MVYRMRDAEEAERWKRKFLDALEEHERREKSLTSRIRLLRRGLLGVSLAGDGHDSHLDRQLSELRASLRHEDREAGLELLFEQIEQSIIRLDNEKNSSNWALKEAFESSLAELALLPLPAGTRRQLKKFSASLPSRLQDPQQHPGLIRSFMDVLREAVQVLHSALQDDAPAANARAGFWQRLFSTQSEATSAAPEPVLDAEPAAALAPAPAGDPDVQVLSAADLEIEAEAEVEIDIETPEPVEPLEVEAIPVEPIPVEPIPVEPMPVEPMPVEPALEGELVRDGSGLSEPAFSFIAGHVEPLLLRILESIHITGESVQIADSVRRHIIKGLNWYDFVAVLEQIVQVLRNATSEQRNEFQDFLNNVTESLAQVQSFVDSSRDSAEQAAHTDAMLDSSVREQIADIQMAVDAGDDLDALKQLVQQQIGAIIGSLDNFRQQRAGQDDSLSSEMRLLVERIGSLEDESRELRLFLARQQEVALKDSLTELPNREAYDQRIRMLLERWRHSTAHERREEDRALCLAVADVDFFKNINDSYGHLAGDKVLKIIARELVSRLRESDFVARYGGEEFVIIMPDTRPADAEHALNKVRLAIAAIPFHFKERQIQITLSFGVVEAQRNDSVESLFERADRALYLAKENGRNRVHRER